MTNADRIWTAKWLATATLNKLSARVKSDIAKGHAASAAFYARILGDTAGHLMALDAAGA